MTQTTISLPTQLHHELEELAIRAGVTIDVFLERMVRESHLQDTLLTETPVAGEALKAAREKIQNRTTEEIERARERIFQSARKGRELPEGKTLEEVLKGTWPGDETDEEIRNALDRIS